MTEGAPGALKVKICGVTRPEDAAAAAESGAWAVGLIFAPESPRRLNIEAAASVAAAVPAGVLTVGVFADQGLDEIRLAERSMRLDLIQLHGGEDDAFCRAVGAGRCIKAVFLDGGAAAAAAMERDCGFLLVDRQKGSGGPGAVDWELAAMVALARPRTILAGGLTPDNARRAALAVRPWALDVSSGVEYSPGVKDHAKVAAFMAAVKGIS